MPAFKFNNVSLTIDVETADAAYALLADWIDHPESPVSAWESDTVTNTRTGEEIATSALDDRAWDESHCAKCGRGLDDERQCRAGCTAQE